MELVFCTNNDHKIREVSQIMGDDFVFLKLKDVNFLDEIPEPFDTLEENSAIKATTVHLFCKKNCFAEDTGLFIETINNEPGVYSARYAGEEANAQKNIEKVLSKMQGKQNRNAFFKTVITLITNDGRWQFEGICKGSISEVIKGRDGFGYDPVFIPNEHQISFAEMSSELKNDISHRKKAFDKFADFLKNYSQNTAS